MYQLNNKVNKPIEYSVSELSAQIKSAIENQFGIVRVRGEISGIKIASSGHYYFNLKDSKSVLNCICWKITSNLISIKIEDGIEVIATGKITTYYGQSRYQLIVDKIEAAGLGALMQLFLQRREKLQQEGLFDIARKKQLPKFPNIIGVITSISGAVIRDIIHRIKARFRCKLIIWSVTVQGGSAADEIAAALSGFNDIPCSNKELRPDVIIVARGGGSIEDLWAFNEEVVVRAVAASSIPVISAIGHEVDFTLTDYAADLRAPTPSAAAEIVSPVANDLRLTIQGLMNRISSFAYNYLKYSTNLVNGMGRIVQTASIAVGNHRQSLDELKFRLDHAIGKFLLTQQKIVHRNVIQFPHKLVELHAARLEQLYDHLYQVVTRVIVNCSNNILLLHSALQTMDYRRTLKRGFAIIRSTQGQIISCCSHLRDNEQIIIQLQDGEQILNIKLHK